MENNNTELLSRASYDNGVIVTSGSTFSREGGFWMQPLANTGSVVAVTWGGQAINHALPVSIFPLKMKSLGSSTAVDVLVMW